MNSPSQQNAQQNMLTISLSEAHWTTVLNALGQRPFAESAPIIGSMQMQFAGQQNPPPKKPAPRKPRRGSAKKAASAPLQRDDI